MQEFHTNNIQNQQSLKEDVPSAPPISNSFGEIKQEEYSPCSKTNIASSRVDSHDVEANASVEKLTVAALNEGHKHETLDASRFVLCFLDIVCLVVHFDLFALNL